MSCLTNIALTLQPKTPYIQVIENVSTNYLTVTITLKSEYKINKLCPSYMIGVHYIYNRYSIPTPFSTNENNGD